MTACLRDLVEQWQARGWREQAAGRPDVAQAIWACARELRRDLDPEPRESCQWPPVTGNDHPHRPPSRPAGGFVMPRGGAMDDDRMIFDGDDLDAVTPDLDGVPEADDVEPVDADGEEPAIDDPEVEL